MQLCILQHNGQKISTGWIGKFLSRGRMPFVRSGRWDWPVCKGSTTVLSNWEMHLCLKWQSYQSRVSLAGDKSHFGRTNLFHLQTGWSNWSVPKNGKLPAIIASLTLFVCLLSPTSNVVTKYKLAYYALHWMFKVVARKTSFQTSYKSAVLARKTRILPCYWRALEDCSEKRVFADK